MNALKLPRRLIRPRRYLSTTPLRFQFQPTAQSTPPPANASTQDLLTFYAAVRARAVTFDDLRAFGVPPLDEGELLKSAENTRVQLLCGLARRVSTVLYHTVNASGSFASRIGSFGSEMSQGGPIGPLFSNERFDSDGGLECYAIVFMDLKDERRSIRIEISTQKKCNQELLN